MWNHDNEVKSEKFAWTVFLCVAYFQRSFFLSHSVITASSVRATFRSLASKTMRCMKRPWRPWISWASPRRREPVSVIISPQLGDIRILLWVWLGKLLLLNCHFSVHQISWRCAPLSCSWETLSSRKRGTRNRPPCPTTLVRQQCPPHTIRNFFTC